MNLNDPIHQKRIEVGIKMDLKENARIKEAVNKPKHYIGVYGLEAITVMKNFLPNYTNPYLGYLVGNVIKYTLRAPLKGKTLEDLKKARKYLDEAIEELEK